MIIFKYTEKKYATLLFFFRLAKRLHFYLISGSLNLYKLIVAGAIFSAELFINARVLYLYMLLYITWS